MQKKGLLVLAVALLGLASCGVSSSPEPSSSLEAPSSSPDSVVSSSDPIDHSSDLTQIYTVTFKDWDDSLLASVDVEEGGTAVYPYDAPSREGDAQYTYSFSGWDKDLSNVTSSFETVAQYSPVTNRYTVTFVNHDGTILQEGEWDYGSTPSYSGETPTKEDDALYTYSFSGWSPEITSVTGDATYTAVFSPVKVVYSITYELDGGTLDGENPSSYSKGDELTLLSPTKTGFTFVGWYLGDELFISGSTLDIVGNVTLTAKWSVNAYTITLDPNNGGVTDAVSVTYGEKYEISSTPTAPDGYYFVGWYRGDEEFATSGTWNIAEDITITAKYDTYFVYTLNDEGTAYTVSASADLKDKVPMNAAVILGEYEGLPVTSLKVWAFYKLKDALVSITFPDSITSVSMYAFYGCSALESVSLGDGVESIEYRAFYECTSLKTIELDNVKTIDEQAFYSCSALESATLDLETMGETAFSQCTSLSWLSINVAVIDALGFAYCSALSDIVIGKKLTEVDSMAFYSSYSVKNVYYAGTSEEWSQITFESDAAGDYNSSVKSATRLYYSDTEPTDTDYKYWHYVDGTPTAW